MAQDLRREVARRTRTQAKAWSYIDGPTTGTGAEYWMKHRRRKLVAYVAVDQGELVGFEIKRGTSAYDDGDAELLQP